MKTKLLILGAFLFFNNYNYAQKSNSYFAIAFSSICCGTPDEKPIFDCIKSFKTKFKIKEIKYFTINNLGDEGEHEYLFDFTSISKKDKNILIQDLTLLIKEITSQRNNNHDGYIILSEYVTESKWIKKVTNATINKL